MDEIEQLIEDRERAYRERIAELKAEQAGKKPEPPKPKKQGEVWTTPPSRA